MTAATEILDPSFDAERWEPARRRRMLLVAYVDFLLFSIPWALLVFALEKTVPGMAELPPLSKWIAFSFVELLLLRVRAWSPGAGLLGVRLFPFRDYSVPIDRLWRGWVPYVSRELKSRESWYTLALATYLLNEGSKTLVRWTTWNPPMPFFGSPTDELVSVAISLASGVIEVGIAVLLYRVSLRAVLVGVPYLVVQLASTVASWELWDPWVAEMLERRRHYQGIPIREGEVEQMQAMTPELLVATLGVMILLLLVAVPRLRRPPT